MAFDKKYHYDSLLKIYFFYDTMGVEVYQTDDYFQRRFF